MSKSYPYAKNMGHMKMEPVSSHHSSNSVQFLCMSVDKLFILCLLCLIHFTVVGDPLYPGFKGCLPIHANNYYLLGIACSNCLEHLYVYPVSSL